MKWYFLWLLATSTSFLSASEPETILANLILPDPAWSVFPSVEKTHLQLCCDTALLKSVQYMDYPGHNRYGDEYQRSFAKKNFFLGENGPIDDWSI